MSASGFKNPTDGSPCYVIHNAFNEEHCKKFIETHSKSVVDATHVKGDEVIKRKKGGPRDSSVTFFDDLNLHNYLDGFCRVANDMAGWRYDITGRELFQFTKYNKGDHYNWHMDGHACHHARRNFTFQKPKNLREIGSPHLVGTVRKISMSVILNDNYEGGEFQTKQIDGTECNEDTVKANAGDVIIFPSYLTHRVKPVTKGTRYSIVVWWAGPPLK